MRRDRFYYTLPPELIAQQPPPERSAGRLLHLDAVTGALGDDLITGLPGLLRAGDLLVFNDTRVLPARVFGRKASGGRVELLVERPLSCGRLLVQLRSSRSPKPGTNLELDGDITAAVVARRDDLFELELEPGIDVEAWLERAGHVPLPPYIERADTTVDRERYQTVFAERPGAVAAPTAGLHFDTPLLDRLTAVGIGSARVTLHIGAGTFQSVRADDLADHRMHAEWLEVPEATCEAIAATRADGGRVVAVGTTAVRSLETAAADGTLRPYRGETTLFITPGYRFRCTDLLLTNFHLPESTLLMLVCAFAGTDCVLEAYRHAVAARYRFFSYGDAMLLTRNDGGAG
ncbi:MAG: tRNA preQ1(34) S-adenosylmethionine ribosyltransferase-isomerase QueA [Gammaproteobacteria bacterium]|nr:MAG: tRNA preQ1(34) S-adenosylmethionine ribosyltransferase-isomerase QueA [Gammaproteobacteria bacterium]